MKDLSDFLIQKIEEQIEPLIGYRDHAKKIIKPVLRSVELRKRGLTENGAGGFLDRKPPNYADKFGTNVANNPSVKAQYDRERIRKQETAQDYKPQSMVGVSKEPRAAAMTTNIREAVALDEARIAIIKARIRGGKVQRRKKVSNVPGFTLRSGKLTRMSVSERRNRKMGQRMGKIKRRAHMTQSIMRRARSLRRRKALGI